MLGAHQAWSKSELKHKHLIILHSGSILLLMMMIPKLIPPLLWLSFFFLLRTFPPPCLPVYLSLLLCVPRATSSLLFPFSSLSLSLSRARSGDSECSLSFRHFCGYLLPRGTSDSQRSLFFPHFCGYFPTKKPQKEAANFGSFFPQGFTTYYRTINK